MSLDLIFCLESQDEEGFISLKDFGARISGKARKKVGDWTLGEDHHGHIVEQERRMNSYRRKPVQLEVMTQSDVVMAKIKGMLNRRRVARGLENEGFWRLGGQKG